MPVLFPDPPADTAAAPIAVDAGPPTIGAEPAGPRGAAKGPDSLCERPLLGDTTLNSSTAGGAFAEDGDVGSPASIARAPPPPLLLQPPPRAAAAAATAAAPAWRGLPCAASRPPPPAAMTSSCRLAPAASTAIVTKPTAPEPQYQYQYASEGPAYAAAAPPWAATAMSFIDDPCDVVAIDDRDEGT